MDSFDHLLQLVVTDNGYGIYPEQLAEVLEQYDRDGLNKAAEVILQDSTMLALIIEADVDSPAYQQALDNPHFAYYHKFLVDYIC